jgi:hypothetical protein
MITSTVQRPAGRRIVRRRGAVEKAWSTVLANVDPALHPLIKRYVQNLREGIEVRSDLTMALSRQQALRWRDIDALVRPLMASSRRA